MGQLLGRAELVTAVEPFVNLDRLAVYELWEAFNDVAEGFGLNVDEFSEICTSLQQSVFADAPKAVVLKAAEHIFCALDTDENLLVDALEVLVTLAMLSALEIREKANFCFTCYDFDESGEITIDEMILLLRSCASGLCKLSKRVPIPEEAKLEHLAQEAFRKTGKSDDVKITREEFVTYCTTTPEIVAWYHHFDAARDFSREILLNDCEDEDLEAEAKSVLRKRTEILAKAPQVSTKEPAQPAPVLTTQGMQWLQTAQHTVPSDVKPGDLQPGLPDKHSLVLEWIYGYQAQEVRGNLAYSCTGDIVYTAATAGVVFNVDAHEQNFNLDHTDEIIAMAMHPDARIVATGERGPQPVINVWDSSSLELVSALKGYHAIGIQCLAFSPLNGTWLVSIGQDVHHSLALYDWRKRELLFSSRTTPANVLDCKFRFFTKSSNQNVPPSFVSCGVDHIYFWNLEGNNCCKQGIFGKIGKLQTMTCLACNEKDNRVVSGALSGHLYQWDQCRNLKRAVKAHDSSITALCFTPDNRSLVSAGKDGKVRMWSSSKLEQGATFDVHGLGSLNSAVSSISISDEGGKLLVGTRGSEIFEISMQDGCNLHHGPLVQAHCQGELHGLSVHPSKLEFVTVGDDRTVRIWDMEGRYQLRMVRVDTRARACCYSPDGKLIAVGFGGGDTSAKKEGAFAVLNEADLTIIHEARDSKSAITEAKFSCDGQTLALGSADKFIYLYNVEDFASIGKCKGHTGMLESMDFSEDSHNLQSVCSNKQLLFWNTETGEQLKKPSQLRDTVWASQTVTLGWAVKAAWMADSALDVTACDRSKSLAVLACGDSIGRVRLFRFPAAADATHGFLEFRGHSSAIRRIQFSSTDATLLSAGRGDRCVFQWAHTVDEEVPEGGIFHAQPDSEDEADLREQQDFCQVYPFPYNPPPVASTADPHNPAFIEDTEKETKASEDEEEATEEEPVPKPWLRSAVAPSNAADGDGDQDESSPEVDLAIDWVYGFNSVDTKGCVRYLGNGEVVFPAAALAVVMNSQEHSQRFFAEHDQMVVCLDVHPEGVLCATGELGNAPNVRVWDSETLECLQILGGIHTGGVNVVRFCSTGSLLITAGVDSTHKIVLYDWANAAVIAQCQGGANKVLDLSFLPDASGFVQCGVDHIRFHQLRGRNLASSNAVLGSKGKLQTIHCLGWAGTRCVAGCADGQLYGFQGRKLEVSVKAHEGAVLCLWTSVEGIATGGKDGRVKLWSLTLEPKAQFSAEGPLGVSSVRSVCWDVDRNILLVANRAGDILELNGSDGVVASTGPLLQSHQASELWALAAHPTKQQFITCGDDKQLRIWDAEAHRMLKHTSMDTCVRAAAYSPDGTKVAVGLGGRTGKGRHKKDGAFIVLNEVDLSVAHEGKDSKQWITAVEWAEDGATLAVGSFDACIYLYDVGGGFSLKGVFDGHNAFITGIDLSRNGQYLRSNCGADELMFADTNAAGGIPAVSTMKDIAWSSTNCALIWQLKGIHAPQLPTPSAVCTNSKQTYAVTATLDGRLCLRRFPCTTSSAAFKQYRAHCAAVQRLRFLANDSVLVSAGGKDRCAIQWKCEESEMEVPVEAGESGADSEIAMEQTNHSLSTQRHLSTELVAMRPWFTSVVPPSSAAAQESSTVAPGVTLELDHVYGIRALDVRNHVKYASSQIVVYFAAAVGIALDKRSNKQVLYKGHRGRSITCLAVHPNSHFVATGEEQYRSEDLLSVHVWDSSTGRTVCILPGVHSKAVKYVAFSPCGKHLASLSADDNQTLFVWRSSSGAWDDAALQARAMGGKLQVLFVHFGSSQQIVTGGAKHIRFWKLTGQLLQPTPGLFGRKGKSQPLLCACSLGSRIVTGTVTGHLYVWERADCVKAVKAHEKSVNALHAARFSGIVSGSKYGVVKLWDNKLTPIRTFDMTEATPVPHLPAVRSVCWNDASGLVLVGTQGADVYEITTENQSIGRLSTAHAMDEVWGLAVHPSDPHLFVTGGDDQTVRVWDARLRLQLRESNVGCMVRCCAWSPDGKLISVGLGGNVGKGRQKKDGVVLVLNAEDLSLAHEMRDSREWISVVRFSPDGEVLAVGSRDNKIYLYEVEKGFVLRAQCESHTSFITNLDFSMDSSYVRSNCGGFDLKFHKVEDGGFVQSPSTLKDVEWATDTCTLAWPVQGIWPEVTDKTHYNSCDRSNKRDDNILLACDDEGKLHVFKYPCVVKGSASVNEHVHTGPLIIARFNSTDKVVFSCGGPDRTICQWKIT